MAKQGAVAEPPAPVCAPKPAAVPPPPASVQKPTGPTFGGRVSKVGDWVYIWDPPDAVIGPQTLRAFPAQLIDQPRMDPSVWHVNIHKTGRIIRRSGVRWSATPALGCWTWMEAPKE